MRFALASFMLQCKRTIFTRATALLLVLGIAVCGLAAWMFSPQQTVLDIAIGLVYNADNAYAQTVAKELEQYSGVHFIQYSPEQRSEVELMVALGELECAYILPDDLPQRIVDKKTGGVITALKSPRTVADALTNEWLFAALLRASAADLVISELSKIAQFKNVELEQPVRGGVAAWLADEQYVKIRDKWEDGLSDGSAALPLSVRPLHGVCALMILLSALTAIPLYIGEKRRLFPILTGSRIIGYYTGVFVALLLRTVALALTFFATAYLICPEMLSLAPAQEIMLLAAYCLSICSLELLTIALLPNNTIIFPLGIALVLLSMLAGGTLLDPSELGSGVVSLSRLLPTSYYLQSVLTGTAPVVLYLLAAVGAALAFVLLPLTSRRKQRRL